MTSSPSQQQQKSKTTTTTAASSSSSSRTFFTSIDLAALASASGNGCDISVAGLCALGAAVAHFFDQLGVAFKPARSDVAGNVRKMKDAAAGLASCSPPSSPVVTVGQLLQAEADDASGTAAAVKSDASGTVGLLWFKRAMEYLYAVLCLLLASRDRPGDFGMSDLCRQAYEATLRPRHSWLVQKTFGMVMAAAPYRSKFLERLALGNADVPPEAIYASVATGVVAMRGLLDSLNAALCRFGVEQPPLPDLQALAQ